MGGLGIRVVTIVLWVMGGGRINIYEWPKACEGRIINCLFLSLFSSFKGEGVCFFFSDLLTRVFLCCPFEESRNSSFVCFHFSPSCCVFPLLSFSFCELDSRSSAGLAAIWLKTTNKAAPKKILAIRGLIFDGFLRGKVSQLNSLLSSYLSVYVQEQTNSVLQLVTMNFTC